MGGLLDQPQSKLPGLLGMVDFYRSPSNQTAALGGISRDRERDAYIENAYGTPWEPFIRGDVAYAKNKGDIPLTLGQLPAKLPFGLNDYLPEFLKTGLSPNDPATPTADTQARAQEIFRRSQYDPILAIGADDPGKLSMNVGSHFNYQGDQLLGLYAPDTDYAYAVDNPQRYGRASSDVHELYHRGLHKLGVRRHRQHPLIDRAVYDDPSIAPQYYLPTGAAEASELIDLKTRAADYIGRRRPMGPR